MKFQRINTSEIKRRSLKFESLEQRRVLATFGAPWPEPRSLSVSFPTDQADIGAYGNSVRQVFDQVADRREWQEAVLRAFQTWSMHANINVGLVPDRGDDFGTIGLSSNDPRFGEFRIGAFPQPGTLANSLPYQTRAGTWAGDLLLNTQTNFFLGDWEFESDKAEIDDAEDGDGEEGEGQSRVELYSVLLHEAGNALGLADNDIAGAVMNGTYLGPNGQLTSSDIEAIRSLYGSRQDIYETVPNNSLGDAARIENPPGYQGDEPLRINGSLNDFEDVDFYRIDPLQHHDKVSIRLQASGISLVKSTLTVFDRNGVKINAAKADDIFANNLQLDIGSLQAPENQVLFVKVSRNASDAFAVGDYRLEIDYRAPELQPSLIPPPHDADASGESDEEDFDDEDYISVDGLFAQIGLLDSEVGTNDTLASAVGLETTPGFLAGTRYEIVSSVSGETDRDLWVMRSPSFPSPVLRISVDPAGTETPELEAVVLSPSGDRVATAVRRRADGGLSLTVSNPAPNTDYVIFVRTTAGSSISSGNYIATADFATNPADAPEVVYSASVTATQEHFSRLKVNNTRLFRFDLTAQSQLASSGVQLSIYDEKTGTIVASFAAAAQQPRVEYVWLSRGRYILRASPKAQAGTNAAPVDFSLSADVLSDDQGPNPIDPTQPPPSPLPDYEYEPLPTNAPPPTVDYQEPPFEDPWISDFFDDFFANYYQEVLV